MRQIFAVYVSAANHNAFVYIQFAPHFSAKLN